MKEPEGLVYWKPSELEAIMKNPKDIKLEETYKLGTADDMRRAAEFTVREEGNLQKAEAIRTHQIPQPELKKILLEHYSAEYG